MSCKKDIKSETNGESLNSQRLSKTFSKTPDLLLTNSKNTQRSQNSKKNNYAPNLNVVRNKNVENKSNDKDQRKEPNNRRNQRGKDRVNVGKRPNPNLVQTMGFLSEGIGDAPVQSRKSSDYSGAYSKGACAEPIQKPRLNKIEVNLNKMDLEQEQKTLSGLLQDDIGDEEEDIKYALDDIKPVSIDSFLNSVKNEELCEYSVKKEYVGYTGEIKTEPGLEIKSEYYHRMDRLFRPEPNECVLFQMPDTLPQKLPDEVEDPKEISDDEDPTKPKPPKLSSLDNFSEGIIGKLVRYKSGRTKLMIGEYHYEVESAIPTEFTQNAVSVNTNPQERSANMYSFGEIQAKYHIVPDFEWLVGRAVKE